MDEQSPDTATTNLEVRNWPLPLGQSRIVLRTLRRDDVDAFLGYRSNPEVARYQGWSTMNKSAALAFIETMEHVAGPKPGAWIQLGIALSASDLLVGDIGLWMSADGMTTRIGYSCAPQFQRRGLTTEAIEVLISALAEFTSCETIHAFVDCRNEASTRLLLRLGFTQFESSAAIGDCIDDLELSYALDLSDRRIEPD